MVMVISLSNVSGLTDLLFFLLFLSLLSELVTRLRDDAYVLARR